MKGTGPNLIEKILFETIFLVEQNADNSANMYLDKTMLLDTYAPLKRINKYKLKYKSKTCQKSLSVKHKLLTNVINNKDPILKEEFHTNYKKI